MSKDTKELTSLLTKLYTIQEDVGAKPKTTAEEKVNKANNTTMQGRGRAAKKSGTRFLELKSSIVARLRVVHDLLEEETKRNQGFMSVAGGSNPAEVIKSKSTMREEIRQAEDEWKEMEGLYKSEARKRKSKFSKEQLDIQQTLVQRLNAEIEKVKEMQAQGFKRKDTDDVAAKMNIQALVSLNATDLDGTGDLGPSAGGDEANWSGAAASQGQGPGVELTEGQSLQIQQIQNRDKEFDATLDTIGEGIQDLAEIAKMQSEEVQRQNGMLEKMEKDIDHAAEHITTVNQKMKDTLDQVRGADKCCVDIMCIFMMVALVGVLIKMVK